MAAEEYTFYPHREKETASTLELAAVSATVGLLGTPGESAGGTECSSFTNATTHAQSILAANRDKHPPASYQNSPYVATGFEGSDCVPVALSTSLKAHSLMRYSAFAGALSVSSEYSAPSGSPVTETTDALYLVPPMVWQAGEQVGARSSPVAVLVSVYPTSLQHQVTGSRSVQGSC